MKPFYEVELERINDEWSKNPAKAEKFAKQYLEQGFSDEDTFSLYQHLGQLIYPRLMRYREIAKDCIVIKFPLDDICAAFQIMHNAHYDPLEIYSNEENRKKVEKGLEAFAKHYFELWW